VNIDKIALFLSNKYNKVFKDKNFSMNELKYEISRLLVGKNMKLFNFNESIKKIEKSILKKISNYGEIKYEPVQMDKINNLLSYNNNNHPYMPSVEFLTGCKGSKHSSNHQEKSSKNALQSERFNIVVKIVNDCQSLTSTN
jgi:hypothetical protein